MPITAAFEEEAVNKSPRKHPKYRCSVGEKRLGASGAGAGDSTSSRIQDRSRLLITYDSKMTNLWTDLLKAAF